MDGPVRELLKSDWMGSRGEPFTVDDLLGFGRAVLDPLFHEPPVGPIPDYLDTHWSAYGCVAEYEERIEAIECWKEEQLSRWLKERVGRCWHVAGRICQLQFEEGEEVRPRKFRFRWIEDPTQCDKLISEGWCGCEDSVKPR